MAHSGTEGLEQARRCAPDVVILDILMPKLEVWRLRACGDVPILLLSYSLLSFPQQRCD